MHADNPVYLKFYGKINLKAATSFLYFFKKGIAHELIWKLKYRDRKDIGVFLGEMFGHDLLKSANYNAIDLIIPVPLHKDKLRKRGFNQSERFAEGLAISMNKIQDKDNLIRKTATTTQTNKRRYERWKNVEDIFFVKDPELFVGKHLLLVDDVVTTGATLEATAAVLLAIKDVKISIATIACA